MAKQILFLDFDGLKFNTLPAHVQYINQKYGITSTVEEYTNNPPLELIINKHLRIGHVIHEDVYPDLSKNFLNSMDWHEHVTLMQDASRIIPLLAKRYDA